MKHEEILKQLIAPLLDKVRAYFDNHPEIVAEWNDYYQQMKQEKAQFG